MTWTYDDTLPTKRDTLRLMVGDTDQADQLVTNEAMGFALSRNSTLEAAAAQVCRQIAARFAREVDTSADGFRSSASQRYKHFKELAERFEAEAKAEKVSRIAGSPFADPRQQAPSNDPANKRDGFFRVGMHDHNGRDTPPGSDT